MPKKSKSAFGSKENVDAAKEAGKINQFDILYLNNGEIGWLDKDNNTVINTPRTQSEISADCVDTIGEASDNIIPSGQTLDEITALFAKTILPQLKDDTLEIAKAYADSIAGSPVEVVEF